MRIVVLLSILLINLNVFCSNDSVVSTISPITLNASYIGEIMSNLRGGLKTGTSYHGMANFTVDLDFEKAHLWKGGNIFINAAHTHGGDHSAKFIGDFQVASNIEAEDLTYFHEMWFNQSIGRADITIGLQDLNVEFASSDYASSFINSSFGVHSTIADNIIAPIFPLTAFGIQFKYNFTSRLAVKLITFDGFPDDFSENNPYNLRWKFKKEDGLLNIGQITWQPRLKERLEGSYSFGGYTHYHITEGESQDHTIWEITNYGFYIVGDQVLAKYSNGSNLNSFFQASVSPNQQNENWYYLGWGMNYSCLFFKDQRDQIGFAIAHAGFDNQNRNETAIELTYHYRLTEQILIQPDFQFIINPSGTDQNLKNAVVSALRFRLEI